MMTIIVHVSVNPLQKAHGTESLLMFHAVAVISSAAMPAATMTLTSNVAGAGGTSASDTSGKSGALSGFILNINALS